MFRAVNDTSPISYVKDARNAKIQNATKNIKGGGTPKSKISKLTSKDVETIKTELKDKGKLKLDDFKKMIDDLTCKE
jgi:hypothetical protein